MPRLLATLLILTVASGAACSSGDNAADPTATSAPTRPVITSLATALQGATPSPERTSADGIEVQGVVGAVDTRAGIIEVRATGGSTITKIELAQDATITRTGGGSLGLSDIRPSDRIVATGVPGGDAETLVADQVTVQQVVRGGPPGANPGG